MSKLFSSPHDKNQPRIDREDTASFFEGRAKKIGSVGPTQAVIYQDKNPELARLRDAAEKKRLLPLLDLRSNSRVLDVGCGTGRWVDDLVPLCAHYHGIDFSKGLIEYACSKHSGHPAVRFSLKSVDDFSLTTLGETVPFNRVLCCGVLIYLNDDEAIRALQCIAEAVAPKSLIILREPIGLLGRLTIKEHFSDDMDQYYNAIYRTEEELGGLLGQTLLASGFLVKQIGDVFEPELNNRAETRQRWCLLERS